MIPHRKTHRRRIAHVIAKLAKGNGSNSDATRAIGDRWIDQVGGRELPAEEAAREIGKSIALVAGRDVPCHGNTRTLEPEAVSLVAEVLNVLPRFEVLRGTRGSDRQI